MKKQFVFTRLIFVLFLIVSGTIDAQTTANPSKSSNNETLPIKDKNVLKLMDGFRYSIETERYYCKAISSMATGSFESAGQYTALGRERLKEAKFRPGYYLQKLQALFVAVRLEARRDALAAVATLLQEVECKSEWEVFDKTQMLAKIRLKAKSDKDASVSAQAEKTVAMWEQTDRKWGGK